MPPKKINSLLPLTATFIAALILCAVEARAGYKYESHGRRDPFVPLVGFAEKGTKDGLKGVYTVEDLKLQGITKGGDGSKRVILNGEIMKEGDKIERVTVISVGKDSVKVRLDDIDYELELYK